MGVFNVAVVYRSLCCLPYMYQCMLSSVFSLRYVTSQKPASLPTLRFALLRFLQAFFSKHPEYAANPFYVFGESYGGHYAPSVAYRVWEGNK